MKAAYITKYSKKSKLEIGSLPIPKMGDDDVLIKIYAASINPIDFKTRDGKLKLFRKYAFPLILGHDLSGVVEKVGKHVLKFKVGDKVYSRPGSGRIGTFAEYIAVKQSEVAIMPTSVSFEEAASLPLVALTSYQSLLEVGKLEKGQKVFISAGSGGVGTIAIQIAKHYGALVTTTCSPKNFDMVKNLGADTIINYSESNFWEQCENMDIVFDTLGGESLRHSFACVKKGGYIVSISGVPDHKSARIAGFGFLKSVLFRVLGYRLNKIAKKYENFYSFHFMESNGSQLETIAKLVDQKSIKPVVDKIFSLDKVQDALDYSESGRARGKIVIKII